MQYFGFADAFRVYLKIGNTHQGAALQKSEKLIEIK